MVKQKRQVFSGTRKNIPSIDKEVDFFSCHTQDYLNYVHVIGDKKKKVLFYNDPLCVR